MEKLDARLICYVGCLVQYILCGRKTGKKGGEFFLKGVEKIEEFIPLKCAGSRGSLSRRDAESANLLASTGAFYTEHKTRICTYLQGSSNDGVKGAGPGACCRRIKKLVRRYGQIGSGERQSIRVKLSC